MPSSNASDRATNVERVAVEQLPERPRRKPQLVESASPPPTVALAAPVAANAETQAVSAPQGSALAEPQQVYGSDIPSPSFVGFGPPLHPFVQGLLQSLPKPDSVWPEDARVKWLRAAANIFDLIYKGDAQVTVRASAPHAAAPASGLVGALSDER